jgi:hypothetical protein
MTIRELPAITAEQLERAGRVWDAADFKFRDAVILHAYGYRCESVVAFAWQMIGVENQRVIARSMATMTEALQRAALASAQTGLVENGTGNQGPSDDTGRGDPGAHRACENKG